MALNGKWLAVEAEIGGNKIAGSLVSSILLTINNNDYTARAAGVTDKGKLSINEDLVPHTLDITGTDGPNKGKTIKAIYRQSLDALVICYDTTTDDYPEEFTSPPGSRLFLVKYKRQQTT